jgi:PRC-barrel domain
MPTVECIETWRGQDVLDATGEKAGHLEEVYYDTTSQEPILLSIKHGKLGRQVTLVPAAEAVLSRDHVRVPYSVDQINHAQSGRVDDELGPEQVAAVGDLFKSTLPSSGPLRSSGLIERRRVEAEKANAHAHELQLDAEKRARELEDARRRAGAAAEEANVAERERQKAEAAALESSHPSPPGP